MLLLLLLPILVSGYLVFTLNPYYSIRLHRYEGQLLYIGSAFFGLICSFFGALITAILDKCCPEIHPIFNLTSHLEYLVGGLFSTNNKDLYLFIIESDVASFVVALIWASLGRLHLRIKTNQFPCPLNALLLIAQGKWAELVDSISRKKSIRLLFLMSEIFRNKLMINLFLESIIDDEYLMITLSDRKVYVGRVIGLGEPNESEGLDQDIEITPFLSGYREKDTLNIFFTTKYEDLDEEISIVIKQEEIVSATKFNIERFVKFQQNTN